MSAPVLSPLILAAVMAAAPVSSRAEAPADVDFTKLSLEELMDVEVTSVSKRRQRVADAAAAIFVIGQEDIRRSGATSVPELLRMVPGVEVARIDANKWAVSIRGFNGRFSGKLLVLIDGRSVYSPLFSGVYWDAQDVVLEDVERIEVIRGPGATMWGANAVNGVINIISKSANDTQGTLLSGGGGTRRVRLRHRPLWRQGRREGRLPRLPQVVHYRRQPGGLGRPRRGRHPSGAHRLSHRRRAFGPRPLHPKRRCLRAGLRLDRVAPPAADAALPRRS